MEVLILLLVVLFAVTLGRRARRAMREAGPRRREPGLACCGRCGYPATAVSSFTCPECSIITFAGLMSRWMIPWRWA